MAYDLPCWGVTTGSLNSIPKDMLASVCYRTSNSVFAGEAPPQHEHHPNFQDIHEIGRHRCKFVPHPGVKVPVLTKDFCRYTQEFRTKSCDDAGINASAAESQKAGNGTVDTSMLPTGASIYSDVFRWKTRGKAIPPFKPAQNSKIFSNTQVDYKTSWSQSTHSKARDGAPTFASGRFVPKDMLAKTPHTSDFWQSRYSLEHSSGKPQRRPCSTGHSVDRGRGCRNGVGAREQVIHAAVGPDMLGLLEEMKCGLRRTSTAPSGIGHIPISFIGARSMEL